MMSLSWHECWSLLKLHLYHSPPIFWVQLHLLKLTYLHPTAGSWTGAQGLVQKPPNGFCSLGIKASKNDDRLVPCHIFKSTFSYY